MKQELSISEAANVLNVTEGLVHELISQGALFTTSAGDAIPRDEVTAYLASRSEVREAALDQMVALGDEEGLPY
jgi:excisionase family DNA binding protein